MRRLVQLLLVATAAALLAPPFASSAQRMYVGFHDDPNFRYEANRHVVLDQARDANTTIVRTLVTWANIAPTQADRSVRSRSIPDYKFDDLDELVRNTQLRGMEVLITIWGTPKWANGGKKPNFLPTKLGDLTTFARVVAERYSGRYEGYPFVRFYSVWNESNLQLFLAPQFDGEGPLGRAAQLRAPLRRRLCGHQGRQLAREGRDRRDVVPRARSQGARASPTRTLRAASPSSSPPRTRASSSTRGRTIPIRRRST